MNAAHLEESLLVLVVLHNFLQDTLVHYLSRHSLHLSKSAVSGGSKAIEKVLIGKVQLV